MTIWPPAWDWAQAHANGVPLGHSVAAHQHLGWCYHCTGVTGTAEAVGWRLLVAGHGAPSIETARQWSEGRW